MKLGIGRGKIAEETPFDDRCLDQIYLRVYRRQSAGLSSELQDKGRKEDLLLCGRHLISRHHFDTLARQCACGPQVGQEKRSESQTLELLIVAGEHSNHFIERSDRSELCGAQHSRDFVIKECGAVRNGGGLKEYLLILVDEMKPGFLQCPDERGQRILVVFQNRGRGFFC